MYFWWFVLIQNSRAFPSLSFTVVILVWLWVNRGLFWNVPTPPPPPYDSNVKQVFLLFSKKRGKFWKTISSHKLKLFKILKEIWKKILHVDFNTLNNPHSLPNKNGPLQYILPYPSPPPPHHLGSTVRSDVIFYEKPDQSEGSFTANTFPCSNGILLKMRKPSLSISPLV